MSSGKIWAGLAILEDGYDQTAEIHAVPADTILSRERELLARHRDYFPRLPIDELNVLTDPDSEFFKKTCAMMGL